MFVSRNRPRFFVSTPANHPATAAGAKPVWPVLLPILLAAWLCLPAMAFGAADEQTPARVTLSRDNIDTLIDTLENDGQREKFIQNLETLSEATDDDTPSLVDALNLDETSTVLFQSYIEFFRGLGLNRSMVGNLLSLLIIGLCLAAATLLNKYIANLCAKKITGLRQRLHFSKDRFDNCFSYQVSAGYIIAVLLLVFSLLVILTGNYQAAIGFINFRTILQYSLVILILVYLFIVIWESANALMEYIIYKTNRESSTRVMTLLPIIRNILFFTLVAISSLVILSELGIDIMPLLAGAGVVGIAIGFGAQALVKDFLNGFIIIFEDLMQIGDVVNLAGRLGVIEKITIRRVQLRSLDGIVHTIPYSDISIVDNYTKEYSYYLMDIGVAYREDIDEVIDCLKGVDEDMRNNSDYTESILEPLEILGLDRFADSALIIRARVKTSPRYRWDIGREYNRRIKMAFDDRNIEIPFPHQTVYFGQDKDGNAPAAQLRVRRESDGSGRN